MTLSGPESLRNMSKEKDIFEAAAKKLGGSSQEKKEKKGESTINRKDPEVQQMLEKIQAMREDLDTKIDLIKGKKGPIAEHCRKILENECSLSSLEKDEIQLAKKLLADKVWDSVEKETNPVEEKENPLSNRKAKTLGSRKKWIPVR